MQLFAEDVEKMRYDTLTVNSIMYSDRGGQWILFDGLESLSGVVPSGKIEWRPAKWSSGKICLRPPVRLESCRLAAVLRQPELALTGFHSIAQAALDPWAAMCGACPSPTTR